MAVRKEGKSWLADFQFKRKRYRERSPLNTKAGAKEYEVTLRQRLARGEPIQEEKKQEIPTFASFVVRWLEEYVVVQNKPSEQLNKKVTLRGGLLPFFGSTPLNEISTSKVEQYKALKIKKGLAPKTINNHLGILGKCLRTALEWEVVEKIPKIKPLKVPPSRFDHLTPQESKKLLETAPNYPWRIMMLVALRTGLRVGELIALEWEDIDLERRILTVRHSRVNGITGTPKNNRIRHIPLSPELYSALLSVRKESGYLFIASHGGPVTKNIAAWQIKKICKHAGLRRIGWHVLRHSFASQLSSSGIPMRLVQELMGHSTSAMTMRYSHLAPSAFTDTVAVLDALPYQSAEHFWSARCQSNEKAGVVQNV